MLANIGGTPLILHVYERVKSMDLFHDVYVATDHMEIKKLIEASGGTAIMTDSELPSGTDRIISALSQIEEDFEFVVNVQGDEALISDIQLGPLVNLLNEDREIDLATLCVQNSNEADFKNPNCVKLVKSKDGMVHYFSRSAIPYHRDESFQSFHQHVGVYAFSAKAIKMIKGFSESDLERIEMLEQLRWMQAGMKIYACEVKGELIGIDTKEDLVRVENLLS